MEGTDKGKHTLSKTTVQLAFWYLAVTVKNAKGLKELVEKLPKLGEGLNKAPTLQKYVVNLSKKGGDGLEHAKKLEGLLKKMEPEKLERLVSKLDKKDIGDFIDDMHQNGRFRLLMDDKMADAWAKMHKINPGSFIKTDPDRLMKFNRFDPDSQKLIAKYTDKSASSTLAKFLDDVDDEFMQAIESDGGYLDCFLSHKKGENWTLSQFDDVAERIRGNASDKLKNKLNKWLDHSSKASRFGDVARKGNELSDNILTALKSREGRLFDDLAQKTGIKAKHLKKYEIYKEVPFATEGGYMKADIVFVKRTPDGIEDVIIIENKLSAGTDYTVRQKEGWKKLANGEDMKLVYRVQNSKNQALDKDVVISRNTIKTYKISDHGKTSVNNVDIKEIQVDSFKNYKHSPRNKNE